MSLTNASTFGFISPTTRIYLKDCLDHTDSVLSSLELFMGNCDKLVDYIFSESIPALFAAWECLTARPLSGNSEKFVKTALALLKRFSDAWERLGDRLNQLQQ